MRYNIAFTALVLLGLPAFGQRGGGGRGAAGIGGGISARRAPAARPIRPSGIRPVGRRGFGNGFLAPYFPIGGDYSGGLADYDNEFPPADNFLSAQPPPIVPPAARPLVAHAVVNEYNWKSEGVAVGSNSPTFTIALKDGSLRYAVATWQQNSKLYYVDSDGKQEALASTSIDRSATQRLNEEKKLRLQLPPG